jgi:uncharacterized protein
LYYNNVSKHLKETFGSRVRKISIMTGFSCPNRDGTLSSEGCIFCDPYGSGKIINKPIKPKGIEEQIREGIDGVKRRFDCNKFIAYFQAFSNTNTSPDTLLNFTERVLAFKEIVGISISTRPDLLGKGILDVLDGINKRTYLWVELGIQTSNDETLKRINRNHTFKDVVDAVTRLHNIGIRVCGHVIFGLPGENREDVLNTAKDLSKLKIDGLKLHSLFIAKNSPLETLWKQGDVILINEDTYVLWVVDFLERTMPSTIIHRLVGTGRMGIHLAPDWCLKKQEVIQRINEEFQRRRTKQGELAI